MVLGEGEKGKGREKGLIKFFFFFCYLSVGVIPERGAFFLLFFYVHCEGE